MSTFLEQAAGPTPVNPAGAQPQPPWRRLLSLLQPDRADLWAVVVFGIAIGGLLLASPIAVQALVNSVAFGGLAAPILVLSLLLAFGLGFAALLGALQAWVVEILQRRLFVRLAADLAGRLPRMSGAAGERTYGPELVNRFFDVMTVQKMSALLLLDGLGVLLGVVIGLLVLAFYHPILLAFDILLMLVVFGIVFGLGRSGVATAIRESRAKYAMAGWLEEIARRAVAFKSPGAGDFVLQRTDALARDYILCRQAHYRVLFRQILGTLALQVVASVALLGLGGLLVIRGELTLGQLVAAELIVGYVVASVAKLGKHLEAFYDLMAAVDKLGNLLDVPLERSGGEAWSRPVEGHGAEVRTRELSYTAVSGRPVLQGLDLHIRPGEKVAITGSSGSGKSTLVEILFGMKRPSAGLAEVDGFDLAGVRLDALRQRVALVRQDEVFEGSIRENVTLGRPVAPEQVQQALRATGLWDEIAYLPQGLDTRLQPTGVPLSEGQVHRLLLARAVVAAPRLLMVDGLLEPMSERSLRLALDVLAGPDAPWTLVVVSNRREVLEHCDRVVRLERHAAGGARAAS